MPSSVKFYIETLELDVYKWGPEDIEPPLIRELCPREERVYPYSTLELVSEVKEKRRFKALYLENDYIRLTILPELNGRLYSAFDKVAGHELFYANKEIKPALFAVRGAWCAAGVEFNFPISHTPTTLEPVGWTHTQYDDGSASVTVGDIECTSRMLWQVEILLKPDSNGIRLKTELFNPTLHPARYYYWCNAAMPVFPESEFIYPPSTHSLLTHPPMDASHIAHLGWPIHNGKKINCFRAIQQHFPVFAEKMNEDFFGIYHHSENYGAVHIADRDAVPGRKVWCFGTARDGRVFIDQLTDSGMDYCELQTGPFRLQSDYRLMPPGGSKTLEEWWLPVGPIGGFNCACREFTANIADGCIRIHAATLMPELHIHCDGVAWKQLSLRPGDICSLELPEHAGSLSFIFNGCEVASYPARACAEYSVERRGRYLEEHDFNEEALELYKCSGDRLNAARLKSRMGLTEELDRLYREMPPANDMSMNVVYEKIGYMLRAQNRTQAQELLETADIPKDARYYYYLGFVSGDTACFELAMKSSWHGLFAFRLEEEGILRMALSFCPKDKLAAYQLGNLLANFGRWEEAVAWWEQVETGLAARNLGLYHWYIAKNPEKAKFFYTKAIQLGGIGGKTISEAISVLGELGDAAAQLAVIEKIGNSFAWDARVQLAKVRTLLANQRALEAMELLRNHNFRLCEGKMQSRELYEKCCEMLAQATGNSDYYHHAMTYPENIGIGKPAGNHEAKWYFLAGQSHLQYGNKAQALKLFQCGAAQVDPLAIEFLPLQSMIPEALPPKTNLRNEENQRYRKLCSSEVLKMENIPL